MDDGTDWRTWDIAYTRVFVKRRPPKRVRRLAAQRKLQAQRKNRGRLGWFIRMRLQECIDHIMRQMDRELTRIWT